MLILKKEREGITSRRRPTHIRSLTSQIDSSIRISPSKEIPEVLERSKKRKRFIILSMLPL
jgi:hypothetical protein